MSSVKRRPDGRYRARFRDEDGREHAKHFVRKGDAQRYLDEVTASQLTGQYVDPRAGTITLGAYYNELAKRQLWVAGTHRAMRQALTDSGLESLELRALRHSHGQQWVRQQTERGLARGTITARTVHMHTILNAAVRDKLIPADPFAGVTVPRRRKTEATMRIPTGAEVATLINAASGSLGAAVTLGAFAGLRAGEIAGLQLGDIEFLRRQIHIRRQSIPGEIRGPKYDSERTIYAPPQLIEMLSEYVGQISPDPWLFTGRTGAPADQNIITQRFKYLRNKLKLSHLRLHDMRHFYASGLIAAGCDVVTVQRAMGHASAVMTLTTYSHLWPTAEDRTRAAAAGMMSDYLGSLADQPRTSDGR